MIVDGDCLQATALGGRLTVHADAPLPLEALYLGGPGRPSWEVLRRIAPIRFDVDATPRDDVTTRIEFERNFGDSAVRCASNAAATVHIEAAHAPGDPRHLPVAMGFAFAQQWARLGHACVHGALLEVEGRGVLVLGQRGAGKSVLATSALAAGGGIVSDDYLLAGEHENELLGERIRAFVSLRQSWAARTLFASSNDAWQPNRSGTRAFLQPHPSDPRFPAHHRIDHVWVLGRPRAGRRAESSLEPISQATFFTALVAATQPLLLGPDFPHEQRLLSRLFTRLASRARPARLETGQDIVLAPQAAWQRLLAY